MADAAEQAKTQSIAIADEGLRRLVKKVVYELHPEQIWLFGSRARGDALDDSDYDLFVVVPDDTPAEKLWLTSTHDLARGTGLSADIFACRRHVFEGERDLIGTMSYTIAQEGVVLYDDRDGRAATSERQLSSANERRRTVDEVIRRWLTRANVDLRVVRNCLDGPFPSPEGAAYHCQQAAEKIIKAGLITAGVHPPKEHDLGKLLALFAPSDELLPILRRLEHLSEYITAFRYPESEAAPVIPVPTPSELERWFAEIIEAKNAVAERVGPRATD